MDKGQNYSTVVYLSFFVTSDEILQGLTDLQLLRTICSVL